MNLKGKTAVVTGGSRGIGKAICIELAKAGANVAFLYAGNTEKANETLSEMQEINKSEKFKAYKCPVNDPDEVKKAFAAIISEFVSIDILINNAGITRDKLAVMMSPEEFAEVIDVNLKGTFNCIRQTLPVMLKNKSGKIINISSVSGLTGNPGQANYSASKAALIGLTKTIAKEYASKGITCNAVCPGFVETDMTNSFSDNEKILQSIPLKRFAKPAEIARLAVFLSSSDSNYITGEVIRIDGGLAM
ncbi:MAG: 3-oxoacyl-[acyl-carrier-protein] reductase [Clostridiales bacterium]|jgi:3-oxoacyl-[acyl-carrier protein] reductase|nr:3-oxoacyl-[acyl-carrier-protein] reductase [Clostridiales bacterium]